MERMTLREAAERSSRSITTLRRYIRSGRLHAEMRYGRFGPEYFVSDQDLREAGLEPEAQAAPQEQPAAAMVPVAGAGTALARRDPAPAESVPISLYQELQMKHEQLLVQYGMVRAAGLRMLDTQAERDAGIKKLEQAEGEIRRLRAETDRLAEDYDQRLRQARLKLEGQSLEIEALREKVAGLEMLTRNAVTTDTIERQFSRVMKQARRVDELRESRRDWSFDPRPPRSEPPEH